jgi:hypothetical protein
MTLIVVPLKGGMMEFFQIKALVTLDVITSSSGKNARLYNDLCNIITLRNSTMKLSNFVPQLRYLLLVALKPQKKVFEVQGKLMGLHGGPRS